MGSFKTLGQFFIRAQNKRKQAKKHVVYLFSCIECVCPFLAIRMTSYFSWSKLSLSSTSDDKNLKIPSAQKGAVFDEHGGPIRITTLPVPEIDNEELLVCICYSGVCRMDLQTYQGTLPWKTAKLPLIGGHKAVCVVVKVGSDVIDFKIGDYIGIKWVNGTCGICSFCKCGHEINCPGSILSGCSRNGTFCQYTTVKALNAVQIPKEINNDLPMVTAILCEGLSVYRALKESNVKPGQTVAIAGAGGAFGRLAIQYARAMGMRVLAIDRPHKEDVCRELGAEFFVSFEDTETMMSEIVGLTDGGPHAALNCAPVIESVENAIEYVRPRGIVVLTAIPTGNFLVNSSSLVMRCITIKGSYVGNRQDLDEAIDFFARGLVKGETEIVPLNELNNVYERMRNNQVKKHIVLDLQDSE